MIDEYQVDMRLPINIDNDEPIIFKLGSTFGYNIGETSADDIWYWDGQDIWLPVSNRSIYAMFKGTLNFIKSGSTFPWVDEVTYETDQYPFPAIGDSLVLHLWPQDYLSLKKIFPEGVLIPKFIVYQNVDRVDVSRQAFSLIAEHADYREYYKSIFTTNDEDEITDIEFRRRVDTWINDSWLEGEGIGIFVSAGDLIGSAKNVPTASTNINNEIRVEHFIPSGVDAATWKRLTVKVINEKGIFFNPSYLIYTTSNIEDERLAYSWNLMSDYVSECITEVQSLLKIQAKLQLQSDEEFTQNPDLDPPPALPEVILTLKETHQIRKVPGIFDPFDDPDTGNWKIQSFLPAGSYQALHTGPGLFGQAIMAQNIGVVERAGRITFIDTDQFYKNIRLPHWLSFDVNTPRGRQRRKRFILGINMETCRRKHFHDLSGNDFLYQYRQRAGSQFEEVYLTYPHTEAWLNHNEDKLRKDFENIQSMGVNSVRIWVFEYFEGLRFTFTEVGTAETGTGSALLEERMRADRGNNLHLHTRLFPDSSNREVPLSAETIHVCNQREFGDIVRGWERRGLEFGILPPSNPLFRTLIDNARIIQNIARNNNIKILWTPWTHYGETKPRIGKSDLIYFSDDKVELAPKRKVDREGNLNVQEWANYYNEQRKFNPPSTMGRLPIEAWIYKNLVSDRTTRNSYIQNALVPFIEEMERSSRGTTLGYDIMNEPDVVWDNSVHEWTTHIKGESIPSHALMTESEKKLVWVTNRPTGPGFSIHRGRVYDENDPAQLPTGWKMTRNEIRIFLSECQEQINQILENVYGRNNDKLILTGVLGTYDEVTFNEMELVKRNFTGSPNLNLSASAMTRYSIANRWSMNFLEGNTNQDGHRIGVHSVNTTPWLQSQNNACLFLEAGDSARSRNRTAQLDAVEELLHSALMNGYAGVFVWNYGNPDRESYGDQNALSEHFGSTEGFEFRPGSRERARPAVQSIKDFQRKFRRLIL